MDKIHGMNIPDIEWMAQQFIDTICNLQDTWPMPDEGWDQFLKDIEYTNQKRGWNLEVDCE